MRRILTGPATLLAAWAILVPNIALAGNRHENGDESAPPEGEEELVIDESEMEADPAPTTGEPTNDDFLDEGGGQPDPTADGTAAGAAPAKTDITPEEQEKSDAKNITVVQRQAFLNVFCKDGERDERGKCKKTIRRFDLQPQAGITVNDPFVRHWAIGAELNYWLTNRMAVGLAGTGFIGQTTPAYDRIRYQNGLLLTANKNVWQASAQYTYEPFYGKIAVFNRLLMHWEAYVQLGAGIIQTQTIPRFEAINKPFNNFNPQGNFAIGSRFYVSGLDFMSFNFSVRTFIFPDRFEPPNRGPGALDNPVFDDPAEAKANGETRVSFSSVFFLGVSFYLPPKFEYSTRR
jgi:outer membrane beta-barrel protein